MQATLGSQVAMARWPKSRAVTRVRREAAAAEERLEISLRRIEGAMSEPARGAAPSPIPDPLPGPVGAAGAGPDRAPEGVIPTRPAWRARPMRLSICGKRLYGWHN